MLCAALLATRLAPACLPVLKSLAFTSQPWYVQLPVAGSHVQFCTPVTARAAGVARVRAQQGSSGLAPELEQHNSRDAAHPEVPGGKSLHRRSDPCSLFHT